jgi:hypothetical protein
MLARSLMSGVVVTQYCEAATQRLLAFLFEVVAARGERRKQRGNGGLGRGGGRGGEAVLARWLIWLRVRGTPRYIQPIYSVHVQRRRGWEAGSPLHGGRRRGEEVQRGEGAK